MNYKDVALLNGSIDSLGQSLLHSRMLQQQQASTQGEQALRGQQIGVEQQRAQTDDDFRKAQLEHYKSMEDKADAASERAGKGSVDAWLQSDDGGTMNFKGPPDALQSMQDQAEAAGKPLTRVDAPKTPAPYAEVRKTLADGSVVSFHTRNQDEFNNVSAFVGKMPGYSPPQKLGAAAIQVMGQVQDYRQKASDAEDGGDQDSADQFNHAADVLEGTLKKKTAAPAALRKSVSTADPRNPANKTTLSGPADQVDQAMAPVITDKSGKKWRYTGTQQDPKQDRNPANWQAAQ
jgi:phage-related minor tail protein